ncbi:MAG: S-methyl-5-thioribose-1-phosphate isomerase [Oscillospiraceae bacterium]|nr:S-methyl-5-thioribose-1-phosphate isomerase [Oscillospiraceae bacterium]
MERMDQNMPFLLRYENVAWYEAGKVRILDRRVFPAEVRFVECEDYREVVQAIADMVTQSAGPYTAVGMGMALAAWQVRGLPEEKQTAFLKEAAFDLAHARPTTANRYGQITFRAAKLAEEALKAGGDPVQAIVDSTVASLNRRYRTMQTVGDRLAELIPQGGSILTQCFGETIIGTVIRAARAQGKDFRVWCAETRPYLQGARLTSSCFAEMGFETAVLTDNMVAYAMQHEGIDVYTSAADSIALDGHIANKVGSFQIAILANHFGIPYYVTGIPDRDKPTKDQIVIEMRDPEQVLNYRGIRNCLPAVRAIYPSFDVVPPHLISGIVTDRGVYVPWLVGRYFDGGEKEFY